MENERCAATGKICYSEKKAGEMLHWVRRKRSKVIPKRKYYCKSCGYWHLTSMSFDKASEFRDGKRKTKYIKTIGWDE